MRNTRDNKLAELPELILRDPFSPTQNEIEEKFLAENGRITHSETEQEEAELQRNPTNFMARIMMRYRRDLGIAPVLDYGSLKVSEEEVVGFISCFETDSEDILTNSKLFGEITEAYSFFKYIGKIPLISTFPDQCREIKENVKIISLEDFLRVYKEIHLQFTVINWDLLFLSPFKNQYFPVTESIIKPFEFTYEVYGRPDLLRTYKSPPSLTLYGKSILQKHVDKISFLNPNTLKGRSVLLYQRIYRRYLQALGRNANPYYIDWEHCLVINWPANMNRSRVLAWTDENITDMNALIDANLFNFEYSASKIVGAPEPLGKIKKVDLDYYADIKRIPGDKNTIISDDEDFGGEERVELLKRIKAARAMNETKKESHKKKITRKVFEEDHQSSEEDENQKEKRKRFESSEEAEFDEKEEIFSKKAASSDEEAEFDFDNDMTQALKKSAPKQSSSKSMKGTKSSSKTSKKSKTVELENDTGIVYVKESSSKLATLEARRNTFDKLLKKFRKQTGQSNATEIDWSLAKVHLLQNHILPFSTNFETTGDIKTLENFIKLGAFQFLNLDKLSDRKIRAYERLYALYAGATGKYRNEYDIEWDDVIFTGLPEKLSCYFNNWSNEKVTMIEAQLRENAITCEMTNDMKERIAEVEASLGLTEDSALHASPSSSTNISVDSFNSSVDQSLKSDDSFSLVEEAPVRMGICKTIPKPIDGTEEGPHFMAMLQVKSPSNTSRKQGTSLAYFHEDEKDDEDPQINSLKEIVPVKKIKKITATKLEADIVKVGRFTGFSKNQIDDFIASVHCSIAQYTILRDRNVLCNRKNLIISEIIHALNLVLQHANCRKVSEIPPVSIDELNEFITLCCDTLLAVDEDGYLDEGLLRLFVVQSVNLRALLSGAKGSLLKTTIKKGIIFDLEMFGFLVSSDPSSWNVEFLEGFLGNDAMPIFNTLSPKKKS